MTVCPQYIVRWVSQYVVPQEPKVRAALRRSGVSAHDIDDVIQEAYCRLATLKTTDHIERPGAYFAQMVQNIWRDHLRRARVVRFEEFTEILPSLVEHESTGVEAEIFAREKLRMVEALLATLPERCRTIFTLKRIEGLSQREIAERLGISENIVENDVQKALRAIQRALRSDECNEQEEQKIGSLQRKTA